MYYYIIPFLAYILTLPLNKHGHLLIVRVIGLLLLLFVFRKHYEFRLKPDLLSVFTGVAIFLAWVSLEGLYPVFGETFYSPESSALLGLRIFSFIIIAPIIEEFFTRNFLARILVSNKWEKVPLGKFTIVSFALTALFFGFSHNRWLPGLIAGILLNYLIWKRKGMNSAVVAHATANILLAFYIVYTKSWFFW